MMITVLRKLTWLSVVFGNLNIMLFDIRVVDTDAPSYCCHTPPDALQSAELDKKKTYLQACQDRRAAFTPLCVSVDGLLGKEADFSSIIYVIFV